MHNITTTQVVYLSILAGVCCIPGIFLVYTINFKCSNLEYIFVVNFNKIPENAEVEIVQKCSREETTCLLECGSERVELEFEIRMAPSQQKCESKFGANSRDMRVKSRLCSKRTFYSAAWKRCSSMGIAACQRTNERVK